MPGMVVAARVDAARDLELELAQIALTAGIGEPLRNLLRHRDRAGIGEAAVIEPGAGDHVADQVQIRGGEACGIELLPDRVEIGLADMRQHDVLRMRHAQLVERIVARQFGHQVDLLGRGVAGNAAGRLEADGQRSIARHAVRVGVLIDPNREIGVRPVNFVAQPLLERRVLEESADPLELGCRRVEPPRLHVREFFLDLADIFRRAEFVHQDLDARLVLVVAAAMAIVDAQAGLSIADQLLYRHPFADHRRDHRGAAHAATGKEPRAEHARLVLDQLDADIVQPHRRPVIGRGDHRDLELARQQLEFGVEGRPLPQQFGPGARIGNLVGGSARELVRADIADAVAAGLDRVHLDRRQLGKNVGRILQLDPVILDVLPGGEMAIALVILARDMGEHVHLLRIERAIGNGDAQHIGVQLQI